MANPVQTLEALRIPIQYLAELFTAGDTTVVEGWCAGWRDAVTRARYQSWPRNTAAYSAGGRDDRADVSDVPFIGAGENMKSGT